MKWGKKEVSPEQVKDIAAKYGCDLLTASILARRGICSGDAVKYFLEDDLRYLRSPFALPGMEDAVERVLAAKEEGEKVLVFGDSDVDGITGTVLLTEYLESIGVDVRWRIPVGSESYGLSLAAVEEFAAGDGTLIITVDCGISRVAEIRRANELSVDVIVTDHHEPQEELPQAFAVINPKLKDSPYPFRDLSGCGVAFKLVSALRFAAKSELYGQPVCLLNTRPLNDAWVVEVAKMRNLAVLDTLTETIVPGMVGIAQTRLPAFLEGQQILVWDAPLQKRALAKLFGTGVEVGMLDIAPEIGRQIPKVAGMGLLRIKELKLSTVARYSEKEPTELDVFVNLFTSFVRSREKAGGADEKNDLQLAALGTIADIMPLLDENRIIVRRGLAALKEMPRPGIQELLHSLDLAGGRLDTKELSWNFCPAINAARRMGSPEKAVALFFEKDGAARGKLAAELVDMNKERKKREEEVWKEAEPAAYNSLSTYDGKLALFCSTEIHKGIAGLIAQRVARRFNVPAVVVAINGELCSGSLRSARGYNIQALLEQCAGFFIDGGGHEFAGGFTLEKTNWEPFLEQLKTAAFSIEFGDSGEEEIISVDAELPPDYLSPDLLKTVDRFEPYGKENEPLAFLAKKLRVEKIDFIGKPEAKHLKMTLDSGKNKWPAVYWQAAEKVSRDKEFGLNDRVDVVFNLSVDYYKGNETPQMIVVDMKKSG